MARFTNPLDHVRIAAPCEADWEQMAGNDRARFCGQCSLNVYNLSAMSKADAERLIATNEGRLCVRFYRRADGTIITKNCPVGLPAIKRRVSAVARAVLSVVLSFFAGLSIYEAFAKISTLEVHRYEVGKMVAPPPLGTMLQPVILTPDREPVVMVRVRRITPTKSTPSQSKRP